MFKIDPKISKECKSYSKNPAHDKKSGTHPQNPTAGPQTYWAPRAKVPQQFPALVNIPFQSGVNDVVENFFLHIYND